MYIIKHLFKYVKLCMVSFCVIYFYILSYFYRCVVDFYRFLVKYRKIPENYLLAPITYWPFKGLTGPY